MLPKNKLERAMDVEIEQVIALTFKKMCFGDESNSTRFLMEGRSKVLCRLFVESLESGGKGKKTTTEL